MFDIIDPLTTVGYDEMLLSTPGASFFHTSAWARVLVESYRYKPVYFAQISNGRLSTLVPLMEIRSVLTGKRGVSLPFTDYCDPVTPAIGDYTGLLDGVIKFGRKSDWKYFEFRTSQKMNPDASASAIHFGHVLNIANGESTLFSGLRESNRRNIRRAKREDVAVTICNSLESVAEFFRLNCLTRKMHGLPPQPYRFFQKLYEHIISKGNGIVALASSQGKYIAANVYFNFGSQAIYKYGASDKNYQYLRANNLVMWEAIRYYAERGYKSLCFGRTEPENTGLLRFKRGWGAEEYMISYYKYDLRRNAHVKDISKLHGFQNRIFSGMPIPILKLAGSLLYRHVG